LNNTPETKRKPEESLDEYLLRLGNNKVLYEIDWLNIMDLMNLEADEDYGESKWRKDYHALKRGYELAAEKLVSEDDVLTEIKDQTLALRKEKIKVQTEKLEYNKMIREDARNELLEEKILRAIENRPTIHIPEIFIKRTETKRDYLFPLADVHYGAKFAVRGWFDEILNEYSPEIAQRRMWDILQEFISYNDVEKINHVNLVNLGDSLDGILRMSQLQWISLGNVDSAIEWAEFLSQWINELSKYVLVDYSAVEGNHTELRLLNGKRGDFAHENMEKIVSHIVGCNLKYNKSVKVNKCRTHMYLDIIGTKVLAVHGHQEKNLEKSLIEYPKMYGHHVDILVSGHLHHGHAKTVAMNGIKDVEHYQVPSMVGIDDFSMEIKKTANAGVDLMIITEQGRKTTHKLRVK
jgi:predicted phosphodiesterase